MILSAICALTFTPAMCALLLRPSRDRPAAPRPARWFFARFNRAFERSRDGYLESVSRLVRHALLVVVTFVALVVATWGLISTRATGLVPPEDQGYS